MHGAEHLETRGTEYLVIMKTLLVILLSLHALAGAATAQISGGNYTIQLQRLAAGGATTNQVMTFNGTRWVPADAAAGGGGGAIVKTGFYTKTDTATTTSIAPTFATAYSSTFTPTSASNLVVITAAFPAAATNGYAVFLKITRGGTDIAVGASPSARTPCQHQYNGANQYVMTPVSWQVIDTPATTSAITYRVEWCVESGGTAYINRTVLDANTAIYGRGVATLKFEEVTP